jgi:PncC family amidohydrolase
MATAEAFLAFCKERDLKVAVAEADGGLLSHLLTEPEGSSKVFSGGVAVYRNVGKRVILGVTPELLEQHGSVSEELVLHMAEAIRQQLEADIGIATTAVAGPGGGRPEKPVGLAFAAVASAKGVLSRRYLWNGDRAANRLATVEAALDLAMELTGT